MRGFNFTGHVRSALALAREEANALNHPYVGTEHLLLGMLRVTEGVAAKVLKSVSADVDEVRQSLLGTLKRGNAGYDVGTDLPYTSRAKKALDLAMAQADEWGHSIVGTEHLLLGLLREGQGIAAQVLMHAGLTLEAVRAQTLIQLAKEHPDEPVPTDSPNAVRSVVVELQLRDDTTVRREFSDSRAAISYLLRH
jgi:ATP-dependent Clp protease ATP-binding subunit ClpC